MAKKPISLAQLVTAKQLRELAGDAWFTRGEAYWTDGHVRSLRHDGDKVTAQVAGTDSYCVRLWVAGRELNYSCTCPLGNEGEFCKHCVAVGLAWIAQADHPDDASASDKVRSYLSGLPVADLVGIVMDCANDDEKLYRRLALQADRKRSHTGQPDLTFWKQAFDEAARGGGYVEYGAVGGYVSGIGDVIDSVEELLRDGEARAVIALAEYAIEVVEDAMENVDDSDGEMSGLLDRLQDLHLAACRASPPNPEALARSLFEWELHGQWDIFHKAAGTYADILGERGLKVYRRLAEAEWKKVPALEPGNNVERHGERFNITSIMETLARQSGDLEALIDIKRRDLSVPYHFLEIAKVCKEAGRADEALVWAERGWRAFAGDRSDDRLREFLADAYQDRGRHPDAMALIWGRFVKRPDLEAYRSLHSHAVRAGAWPDWREKALSHIRERSAANRGARESRAPARPFWTRARNDHSLLVEIFLWERKPDNAWHEARTGGCSSELWLQLAERRQKTHPADAIAIYRNHITQVLTQTDNRAYREAMQFLRKVRELATTRDAMNFGNYTAELRTTHRRKRNFIKLLDQEKW